MTPAALLALLLAAGAGDDGDDVFEAGANAKSFAVVVAPDDALGIPNPLFVGAAFGRLKLALHGGDIVDGSLQPVLVAQTPLSGAGTALTGLGGSSERAQVVDLAWRAHGGALSLSVDRASLTAHVPHADVTLGRQAVSFGRGVFFTPMDLVAPFSPAALDREYKPGADAARADVYFGTSGALTAVAVYGGAWALDESIFAAHLRATVRGIDLGAFAAGAYGDTVLGADAAGDVAGVGLHGEATATLPHDGGRAFLRATAGATTQLPANAELVVEAYLQTLGATSPAGYLAVARSARAARGELWLLGRVYAAALLSWQVTPLVRPAAFALANLEDGSALLGPSLSWSVADDVELVLGAEVPVGARPAMTPSGPAPRSELGLYPTLAFGELSVDL